MNEFNVTRSIDEILKRYEKFIVRDGYKIDFIHGPDVIVLGDRVRMEQVIYNLLNNAVNYTGEDKLVTVRQQVKGDFVRIDVIDTGEGIEEEKLKYIWDRYYKIDKGS